LRILLLLAGLLLAAPAGAQEFPALAGRVVDQADLLTPGEEAYLSERLAALEARTTDQLVIVTVPSLGGRTIEQFGLALGNHWRIGQAGRDNGVLLIVAPAERKVRIEVGYGLERILTDARAARIIETDIVPRFVEGSWYEGIRGGTRAIIAILVENEREPRRRTR
jgi:uncharacterized protein